MRLAFCLIKAAEIHNRTSNSLNSQRAMKSRGLLGLGGSHHTIVIVKFPQAATTGAIFFMFLADIPKPMKREMNTL